MRGTIQGIEVRFDENGAPKPLEPSPDADQEHPRRNYVYAHVDKDGNFFYIGKGTGRRAWSPDRHDLWEQYVKKHLAGNYRIQILQDNLTAEDAEQLEASWMAQYGDELVNWVHMGRSTDFKALEKFHQLRDANRVLLAEAKALEKNDPQGAIDKYTQAIEAIKSYAFIRSEGGLIEKLLDEDTEEFGRSGEIEAIDRLTMCLCKLGRKAEAVEQAQRYFAMYQRDLNYARIPKIEARIGKNLVRIKNENPVVPST